MDFIYEQPHIYLQYLALAQQYHCRRQIGDKGACHALGREIAELILPCAQQSDARLLCFIPEEILDLYAVETVDDGGEGERIVSWRYVGENSASADENGSDDEDADEEGEDELTEDDQDGLESGEAEDEELEDDDNTRDHAGELSFVKGRTISSH